MLNKHKLVKIQPIRKILFYAKGFTLIVIELTIDVKDKTEKNSHKGYQGTVGVKYSWK
ncbi:hypothetical protein CHBNIII8_11460 [Haemophilus influenzae]|nr:hypothetical protein CHBNIII8_11460 [Haemophilus influenzae]GBK75568.1 hypothetical protein NTHiID6_11840 [Haemophilus influenzae]